MERGSREGSGKKNSGKGGSTSSPWVSLYNLEKDAPQRGNSPTQRCTVQPAKFGPDFSPNLFPWLGHFMQLMTCKEGKTD